MEKRYTTPQIIKKLSNLVLYITDLEILADNLEDLARFFGDPPGASDVAGVVVSDSLFDELLLQGDLTRLELGERVLHAVDHLRRIRTTEGGCVPGAARGVPALADEDLLALQASHFGHNVVDDPLHHPVTVEQPVVDPVVVSRADGPGSSR